MDFPLGRAESSLLIAVERANGGELAPLAQVLWTRSSLDRAAPPPGPEALERSVGLLVDARLVEFIAGQLGLTPAGRKLLRRAGGMPNDPRHLERVAALLADIDDGQLSGAGEAPSPSAEQLRRAAGDEQEVEESGDGYETPAVGIEVPVYARGAVFGSVWVPPPPRDDGSPDELEADAESGDAPVGPSVEAGGEDWRAASSD